MTSIPVYVYVPVVLALLGLEMFTVRYAMRRIATLQAALLAKKVLLRRFEGSFEKEQWLVAGETMTLQDSSGNILEITSSGATKLNVKVFDR